MENNEMYNDDGTFKPLSANYGNVNGELANLRNTYMESEKEYFEKLLEDESIRNYFVSISENINGEVLIKEAMNIQEKLETGNLETPEERSLMQQMSSSEREMFHLKKLEKAEGIMCILFAAARDKEKILELVRTYSGKSR